MILAVDVSGSMCATDVSPNRLAAAQDAVRDFIDKQDDRTRIGLVVFSGFAQVAVAPTTNHDELLHAVDGLTTGRGTTIGAAILKSIDAIAEINPDVAPAVEHGRRPTGGLTDARRHRPPVSPTPKGGQDRAGDRRPADRRRQHPRGDSGGRRSAGGCARGAGLPDRLRHHRADPDGLHPRPARRRAVRRSARGLRRRPRAGRAQLPRRRRGGAAGGRPDDGWRVLQGQDADQLQGVLNDLPKHVDVQERNVEISVAFAGLAALLLLLGLGLAGRWTAHPQ